MKRHTFFYLLGKLYVWFLLNNRTIINLQLSFVC